MDTKKASLLAALTAKSPLQIEPDTLPTPSERTSIADDCLSYLVLLLIPLLTPAHTSLLPCFTRIGIKRKSSALTENDSPSSNSAADKSFALIMKDTTLSLDTAPAKKKPKILEFKATTTSTPPGPSSTAVRAKSTPFPFQMKERTVTEEQLAEKLHDLELLQLASVAEKARLIRRLWRTKGMFDTNFVVVGVVCHMWKRSIPSIPPSTVTPLGKSATPSSTVLAQQAGSSDPSTASTAISSSQPTKSKGEVLIVRLSDLQRTSVSISINPSLQSKLSLGFGSVVLILNPVFISALDGDGILLTIEKETQVCVVGISSDIGLCKYRQPVKQVDQYESALREAVKLKSGKSGEGGAVVATKELEKAERQRSDLAAAEGPALRADGESEGEAGGGASNAHPGAKVEAVCPNFVNATVTDYCEYHMFELVRHTKSQRMVLNDAGGGSLGSKAQKKESSSAAKHLSDGMFSLFDCKWRVSERGVKLVTHNEANPNGPSTIQMCVMILGAASPSKLSGRLNSNVPTSYFHYVLSPNSILTPISLTFCSTTAAPPFPPSLASPALLRPGSSDKMADTCPRGGRNLRASVLGVASEGTSKETDIPPNFTPISGNCLYSLWPRRGFMATRILRSAVAQIPASRYFRGTFLSSLQTDLILCFVGPSCDLFLLRVDTPEAQLRLWKRDKSSVSTSSHGPPMHPNSLLPRSRPK